MTTRRPVVAELSGRDLVDFNAKHGRDGEGQFSEGGGAAAGALKDGLKLAGRIKLDEGETFGGSDKFSSDYAQVRVAVTSRGGQRSLRLGIGNSSFGSRDDDAGPWRGDPGSLAEKNAERKAVDAETKQLGAEYDALDARRWSEIAHDPNHPDTDRVMSRLSEIEHRLDELADADTNELYASGHTARLDAAAAAQLRRELADAVVKAKIAIPAHEAAWDATPDGVNVDLPYVQVASGVVHAEWGDVHYDVDLDEPESGPQARLWVVPKGVEPGEIVDGDEHASLDLAELEKVIRMLDKMSGPTPVSAAARRGIELARTGEWKLASGPLNVTKDMLRDAARFAARAGARPAPLKIGHTDKRFVGDGEPALGWLKNLRVGEDGDVLIGDIDGMPEWLATAMPTAWPDRSIEGFADYVHGDGERYGLVVDGLALLGVTPPGMSSIASLRDLPAALGVAASAGARRVVASFGGTSSSGPAPVGPPINQGAQVDPVKIREALGLDPGASDEEVTAAGLAAFPSPAPTPVAAAAGTVVLASSVWDETQKTIRTLTDFVEQSKRNERDEVITKAVQAGKFTPVQKGHFTTMWDDSPTATRALIEAMTPNTAINVMASGYAGEGVQADPAYHDLFGNSGKEA